MSENDKPVDTERLAIGAFIKSLEGQQPTVYTPQGKPVPDPSSQPKPK